MDSEVKPSGIGNATRSDYQSPGNRSSGSHARRDLDDIADDVADKARDAGDTLKDKASDAAHAMQQTGEDLAEKAKHTHRAICDYTKENPTAAMITAIAVGVILSRILPGR